MSQRVEEKSVRRINWNRYADFRSRNTKSDLVKLCSKYSESHLTNAFRTADNTGLMPIHWASVHNRSDLIEVMLDEGSPLRDKCRNKLFADGTPLHLAAMNGSIEVVAVLLSRCGESAGDWLRERDADGQTPLMRCAAPRSKRMDTVRDLLRKNLWSLSGRPAEVALFMINRGANWRETDSIEGMNLMHLAIVNDYEDIVCLLLVLDKKLASTGVQLRGKPKPVRQAPKPPPSAPAATVVDASKKDNLESVELNSPSASSASTGSPAASDSSETDAPLIDKRTRTKQLVGKSLLPLQLAIIFGRVSMIYLLWSAQDETTREDSLANSQRLRSIIYRVYWTDTGQSVRFVRSGCLKFALALDLTLITLVWMPVYLDNDEDRISTTIRNGVFVLAYFVSMALAFRVMLMKPGYLRRNEPQYFTEMESLANKSIEKQEASQQQEQAGAKSDPRPKVKDTTERVRILCHKCHCIRRPRSRHCNYCNRCIQDFDHHCIYLSCCIGRKNRLDFLLTMLSVSLMAIYGSYIQMNSIEYGHWHRGWHLLGFLWIFKYVLIGGLTSFCILKRASHGVTMYEEIRSDRIRRIFGSHGPPDSISKSHRYYSTLRGGFWRYSPNRFLTGDLPAGKIMSNLREYANFSSIWSYLLLVTCADTQLARTVTTINGGSGSDTDNNNNVVSPQSDANDNYRNRNKAFNIP